MIGYADAGVERAAFQGNLGGDGNIFFPDDVDPDIYIGHPKRKRIIEERQQSPGPFGGSIFGPYWDPDDGA